jgi:predicted ester cyclase
METSQIAETSTAITNMTEYFKTHDIAYVAENAVFRNMTTKEEVKGREAIKEMLHHIYHVAFDAKAEVINTLITENKALLEATFSGKHIGEFAGLAATNKNVSVPLCVAYDLNSEGLIQTARIYMLTDVMMQQLK